MGLNDALQNLTKDLEAGTLENEGQSELETKATQEPSVVDLDTLEKFKWQGKEWTKDELQKAALMQSDYSKKTEALAQDRKYVDNLQYDINHVLNNPQSVSEFKRIYPKQYHHLVDDLLQRITPKKEEEAGKLDPKLEERFKKIDRIDALEEKLTKYEEKELQAEVKTLEAEIDKTLETLSQKYKVDNPQKKLFEELVVTRVSNFHSTQLSKPAHERQDLTPAIWDEVAKRTAEILTSSYKGTQESKIKEQKQASQRARDIGGGGGVAGQAPPAKMKLKDVKNFAIEDLSGVKQ